MHVQGNNNQLQVAEKRVISPNAEEPRRVHCARTDNSSSMTPRTITPFREWQTTAHQADPNELTGYESPQRRRYLRDLAEQETNKPS